MSILDKIITSPSDIPADQDSAIVILCEQQWNHKGETNCSFSSLQGIVFAKYLRRVEKRKNPIIFTSFLSPDQLLSKPNTSIITAIGHGFVRMPEEHKLDDAINAVSVLNEIQLNDIIINFCQLRSSVRESFHAFKGRIREIQGLAISAEDKNLKFEQEFDAYERELFKDVGEYPQIIAEFRRIVNEYRQSSEKNIGLIENIQEETFARFLPTEDDEDNEVESTKKPWKVLFLDDKPTELESILEHLRKRKIGFGIAKTCGEAKVFIEADTLNMFTVVVSDYRLFEETSDWAKPKMQAEQGYDFLMWLSKQNRFSSMIALSGLSKWFLMDSFRKYQVNVKVYSKNGLSDGGAKLFVDDLEYLGDRQFNVLCSQPKATTWHKNIEKKDKIISYPLKSYYVFHRNHPCYESVENELNRDAEKIAREIEYALDAQSNSFAPIISTNGNALTNMKGKLDEDEYAVFQLKLLYRRIFYYLLLKGFNRDAIARMLHKGDTDTEKEMSEQLIRQVPYYLGVQAEGDIPYRLLVEEIYFLQHYMSLPIYESALLMDQTYVIINEYINKHLAKSPHVKDEISRYLYDGQVKAVSINEAHIILRKIVDVLDPVISKNLIYDVQALIETIAKSLPKFAFLAKTTKEINSLSDKVSKKIRNQ
ncbi:MAG: hypothetical protein U0Y10_04590 [Spirosomataceae bacterium]